MKRGQSVGGVAVRDLTFLRMLLAAVVAFAIVAGFVRSVSAADDPVAKATALVRDATATLDGFFAQKEWEALRNLLAGARAIYVSPDVSKGGFILGISGGDGILLRRHGASWSDPVFMSIHSQSVGMQAGMQSSNFVMMIMTDAGVDDLLGGVSKVGATSGFALANWGASGDAAGGRSGGLQVLMVSTNTGAFAGGGLARTQMRPSKEYNDGIYGAGIDLLTIAAGDGRSKGIAQELQELLSKTTQDSWNLQ